VFAVDFGAVQVGSAAFRTLPSPARIVSVSGVGFSAAASQRGVVVAYEPYEPGDTETGRLVLRIGSRIVHMPLRGHGVDTIAPTLSVATPRTAVGGRTLMIRFTAADNDLVAACALAADGRRVARVRWPATSLRWRVPATLRGAIRIVVSAVDRAGNVASVARTVRVQPKP
jgi:hypothetical protein